MTVASWSCSVLMIVQDTELKVEEDLRYEKQESVHRRHIMAIDPICKMNVSDQAKYTSTHNGTNYYFCSAACKHKFDKNPSKHVK